MLTLDALCLSDDGQQVLLFPWALHGRVDHKALRRLLARSDFRDFKIEDADIDAVVASLNQSRPESEDASSLPVPLVLAHRRDAGLVIELTDDGMAAYALVTAPCGGQPLTEKAVRSALELGGVRMGILQAAIDELLVAAAQAQPGSELRWLLAKGKPAGDGEDSRFQRLVSLPRERVLQPRPVEGGSGQVDMRDLGQLETVKPGTPLMRRHPAGAGTLGYKVTGESLAAKPGKELAFNMGSGVEASPSDPDLLLATREGLPQEIDCGMGVDEVFTIREVDARSGHVNFPGNLLITGNVHEGMRIIAGGSVTVAGFVEAAYVEAGGDVTVGKGIIGHPQTGSGAEPNCVVRAAGTLCADYVQYARLVAGQDVLVAQQLIHSQVEAGAAVRVVAPSGSKGALLGGSIQAGKSITAVVLGAQSGQETQLLIAGEFADLQAELRLIKQQIQLVQERLQQVVDAARKVKVMPDGQKKQEWAKKLAATHRHHLTELAELTAGLEGNRQRMAVFLSQARVEALKQMHPGTRVAIAEVRLLNTQEHGPCAVVVREGRLGITSL